MTFDEEWLLLSARIKALASAVELDASIDRDNPGRPALQAACGRIIAECQAFVARHEEFLSVDIKRALMSITEERPHIAGGEGHAIAMKAVRRATVKLILIDGEVSHLIAVLSADIEPLLRSLAELAFHHLARSIVVDDTIRTKWRKAFDEREDECERLGAVHLLGHGVYAFKVNAIGARTDLVFNDTLSAGLAENVRALVATEWKIARNQSDADEQFAVARSQLEKYAAGPLADTELRHTRYAIVVTDTDVISPDDIDLHGTTYRHFNIPVSPLTPSVAARRVRKKA